LLSADGAGRPRRIELQERLDDRFTPLLSPDGRFALIRVFPKDVPQAWRGYSDPLIKLLLPDQTLPPRESSLITQFVVWDTHNGTVQMRVDAPQPSSDGGIGAKWATDSTSVLVTLLYMPLDGVDAKERQRRASGPFTAEIDLSGSVRPLASESLLNMARIESWDGESGVVSVMRDSTDGVQRKFFRKRASGWQSIGQPRSWRAPLDVSLKEAMNLPPRIVVFDPIARQERTLLDLNPQFNALTLARQEEIEWRATDGTRVRGGLYYPPDFVRGKRYPLVIQTHGWNPKLFAVDGVFVTAFAAQALANKGMLVLQAWDFPEEGNEAAWQQYLATKMSTPAMHKLEQAIYEGAIDHLDSSGLVDRDKVGLIGFSYTAWSVKYALAHPQPGYRFAAAAVSDGFDGGYFDYIVEANQAELAQQFESSAGGKPYGEGLQAWLREAPGFNVDKVDTPLRMLPLGNPQSLLHDWEWFVLLKRMGKPVELVMVENGAHTLVKPWDRMVVSGGNVEWFDFWLNGAKYERWEHLRR
jgi:dipeptidyl aminopeptidase/acylaminoacyl peptidase